MAVDEGGYLDDLEPAKKSMGVRTAVMASIDVAPGFWRGKTFQRRLEKGLRSPVSKVADLGCILRWGMKNGMSRRVKTVIDIDQLVKDWIDAIVKLCLAHTKDDYDAADAQTDKLLSPILTAPVRQVREFYAKLEAAMEADPRVPWLVKMGFTAWGAVMVKDAPDEGVKRLKNKLAGEIAELVEMPAKEQLPEAIKRALRWRSPEALEEIKTELENGKKPKLVGRESCLFLEVGRGKKKKSVML
jgi:hypothetical protein